MTFGNRFVAGQCGNRVRTMAGIPRPLIHRTIGLPNAGFTTVRTADESYRVYRRTIVNIPADLG